MLQPEHRRMLLIVTITIVAMLVLASGLSRIITPPESFQIAVKPSTSSSGGVGVRISGDVKWVIYVFLAVYVLTLIAIFLTPDGRRRFLAMMVLITAAFLALIFLPRKAPETIQAEVPGAINQEIITTDDFEPEPTAIPGVIEQPAVSIDIDRLVTLTGIILAAGLVVILVLVWVLILQKNHSPGLDEEFAQQAQSTLDELEFGSGGWTESDFRDVIIRCYAEMSRILLEERGIERSTGMTPHEFETTLVRLKFPKEPVWDLTHLFEEARYGNISQTEVKIELAKSSLRQIIDHCQPGITRERHIDIETGLV